MITTYQNYNLYLQQSANTYEIEIISSDPYQETLGKVYDECKINALLKARSFVNAWVASEIIIKNELQRIFQ